MMCIYYRQGDLPCNDPLEGLETRPVYPARAMVLPQNNSHLYAQVLVAVTQVEATLVPRRRKRASQYSVDRRTVPG